MKNHESGKKLNRTIWNPKFCNFIIKSGSLL